MSETAARAFRARPPSTTGLDHVQLRPSFSCAHSRSFAPAVSFLCFSSLSAKGGKAALSRTLDVYNLQDLSDEPDPHATLPFISHHTLNLTRDLHPNEANLTNNNCE